MARRMSRPLAFFTTAPWVSRLAFFPAAWATAPAAGEDAAWTAPAAKVWVAAAWPRFPCFMPMVYTSTSTRLLSSSSSFMRVRVAPIMSREVK